MDDEFAKFYEECSAIESSEKRSDSKVEEAVSASGKVVDNNTAKDVKRSPGTRDDSNLTGRDMTVQCKESDDSTPEGVGEQNSMSISSRVVKETSAEGNDDCTNSEKSENSSLDNITIVDGERIYTNPETKEEFSWSDAMRQWVPRGYNPVFDGTSYRYTDKNGDHFIWNTESSCWEKSEKAPDHTYGFDGENYTYTDSKDNTVYFWDKEKNAWFPKVDEDFMARYQMNYGFVDNTSKEEPAENAADAKEGKRKAPSEPSWFDLDDAFNTKVYVSNLPTDITEQEFIDFMQKCGLVLKDIKTNKFKVKLYKEPDGTLKGDALCDYIKIESVELALNVLDGSDFKGKKVRVQRAKFQMKGDYNPSLKPKKKRKNEKEKEKKLQQKLLDWRPDKLRGEREKHERTVVIKNMFTPSLFDENVELILEYTEDIRSEASKCGTVRKVTLYDKNPEGVATVTFSDAEEADICVKFFNNRWFGKRKIIAETWDGKTKYKVVESEVESRERLDKWNKFLEQEEMVKQ